MTIDVISACYGGYDDIKPPVEQDRPVRRWIMVTDDPGLEAPGWEVVVERRPHLHPNVAAKVPKLRPDLYSNAQYTIWIDASATILSPGMSNRVLNRLVTAWAMYPHPNRNDIGDEVLASRGLSKYDDLPMEEQVAHYYSDGYTRNAGLWATGIIGRDHSDFWNRRGIELANAWLTEIVRWGFQDQLSFAYLAVTWNWHVSPIGQDLWSSDIVHFGGHRV